MRRQLALALTALVLLVAGTVTAVGPAAAGARGDRIVRHSCPNWVWFGPRSWDAGCGTYGITVLGNRGATIDLGFSSTLCAPGQTYDQSVKRYFRTKRAELRSNGWVFDATSRIVHPRGTSATYRRQTVNFHTNRGTRVKGVGTFDYDFQTTVDGLSYCYQRSIARYANRPAWNAVKGTLAQVERSFAYSGPGAYENTV
jgi:hypothetical protein